MTDPGFPRQERQPIIFAIFFLKLHEKGRNLTEEEQWRTPLPLREPKYS